MTIEKIFSEYKIFGNQSPTIIEHKRSSSFFRGFGKYWCLIWRFFSDIICFIWCSCVHQNVADCVNCGPWWAKIIIYWLISNLALRSAEVKKHWYIFQYFYFPDFGDFYLKYVKVGREFYLISDLFWYLLLEAGRSSKRLLHDKQTISKWTFKIHILQ